MQTTKVTEAILLPAQFDEKDRRMQVGFVDDTKQPLLNLEGGKT